MKCERRYYHNGKLEHQCENEAVFRIHWHNGLELRSWIACLEHGKQVERSLGPEGIETINPKLMVMK